MHGNDTVSIAEEVTLDGEKSIYSSAEVANMLGLAPSYMRVILRRHPDLAPCKIGNSWVWKREDVDRIAEWHNQRRKNSKK
jgi:hypothetical protein